MARPNQSYLIYIDDKPFCVVYGQERDAEDIVAGKDNARYEPICTITVQNGLVQRGDA